METFALLLSDPWRDQDRNHRWPREPCRRASHGWWSIEWSQGQRRGTPTTPQGPERVAAQVFTGHDEGRRLL